MANQRCLSGCRCIDAVLIGVCLSAISVAQTAVAEEPAADEIRRLESQLSRAIVAGDVGFFDRVFADDFTHGSQSGKFRTKAEWMKGKEQGKSAYVSILKTSRSVSSATRLW